MFKVFIIDEVHMLTPQAFNALLKTLEEPPAFVKFILATTDPLKLPATILSRTQHFRFKKIAPKNVLHHLTHILNLENITYENEALQILIRSGEGSLRDTLTLLDQAIIYSKGIITLSNVTDMLGIIDPLFLDNLFDIILNGDDIKTILESLESYEIGQVLNEITIYLREKMILNDKRFELYLYDKFFHIIADSKQLLNMNSDSSFVLILTILKFREVVNIKTKVIEDVKVKVEDKFQLLIKKVYEQNSDLGKCFENSFKYISFSDKTLRIDSIAEEKCRKLLYRNFSELKTLTDKVYGHNTQFEFVKNPKNPTKDLVRVVQPSKFINEEINGSSCMQNLTKITNPNLSQQDLNMEDILNSKMVATIVKLFQPNSKPTIKSKT
jgi:DNA polymerase-3 subunit gamma/tau